jgi:hypothetical protein
MGPSEKQQLPSADQRATAEWRHRHRVRLPQSRAIDAFPGNLERYLGSTYDAFDFAKLLLVSFGSFGVGPIGSFGLLRGRTYATT